MHSTGSRSSHNKRSGFLSRMQQPLRTKLQVQLWLIRGPNAVLFSGKERQRGLVR